MNASTSLHYRSQNMRVHCSHHDEAMKKHLKWAPWLTYCNGTFWGALTCRCDLLPKVLEAKPEQLSRL